MVQLVFLPKRRKSHIFRNAWRGLYEQFTLLNSYNVLYIQLQLFYPITALSSSVPFPAPFHILHLAAQRRLFGKRVFEFIRSCQQDYTPRQLLKWLWHDMSRERNKPRRHHPMHPIYFFFVQKQRCIQDNNLMECSATYEHTIQINSWSFVTILKKYWTIDRTL